MNEPQASWSRAAISENLVTIFRNITSSLGGAISRFQRTDSDRIRRYGINPRYRRCQAGAGLLVFDTILRHTGS